jgi:hypothetical protein
MADGDPRAEARRRAAWERHGEALTAWWVAGLPDDEGPSRFHRVTPGGPGTRPWAWWRYSAPERRRRGESEAAYLRRRGLLLPGEDATACGRFAPRSPRRRDG